MDKKYIVLTSDKLDKLVDMVNDWLKSNKYMVVGGIDSTVKKYKKDVMDNLNATEIEYKQLIVLK